MEKIYSEKQGPTILAIESSCDDTSAALIKGTTILSNLIATQDIHRNYGGVVPELASREHHRKIIPVVNQALQKALVTKQELDAVAVTQGPGLLGSLLVGCSFAKGLAYSLNIPLITVNHMEAHVLAHWAEEPYPSFPFLCLTVSGGHTQIVQVRAIDDIKVIGTTIDDAAGEAFDKIGKYLGLDYPAGPIIDRYAQKGSPNIPFTHPKVDALNFSFSGLKTAVMYHIRDELKRNKSYLEERLYDICSSVQEAIITILMAKLEMAAEQTGINNVGIAGGVSANSALRTALQERAETKGWEIFVPSFEFCTDNAGMIAVAAKYKYDSQIFADLSTSPDPRMKIT